MIVLFVAMKCMFYSFVVYLIVRISSYCIFKSYFAAKYYYLKEFVNKDKKEIKNGKE